MAFLLRGPPHAASRESASFDAGRVAWRSASRSKKSLTACTWARQSSMAFMAPRKASPPGKLRTAQPICLRALRTPVNSPYSA